MKKITGLMITLTCSLLSAYAQELPKKQSASIRLPNNSRIDGTASEWDNTFQAYNTSTEILYTIANNDDDLYLIIKAAKPRIVQKIIRGAITITLTGNDKKNKNVVIFPLLPSASASKILSYVALKPGEKSARLTDSLVTLANNTFFTSAKEIKIMGMSNLTDTITNVKTIERPYFRMLPLFNSPGRYVDILNEGGIKASTKIDNVGALVYEVLIPRKFLGLPATDTKISSAIKLNGTLGDQNNPTVGTIVTEVRGSNGIITNPNLDIETPTDFSADYVFQKN